MLDVRTPYRAMLLATDGSQGARRAAAHALYLARALGVKLYTLYVVDTRHVQRLGIHYQEALRELNQEGKEVMDGLLEQAEELGVDAEAVFAEGTAGEVICRVAAERQVDMIVMGATGKSALEEILLGSVSEYVLHRAKRPVLIVRG